MTDSPRAPMGDPTLGPRASLLSPGARRWYRGGAIGLFWLANVIADVYGRYPDAATRVVVTGLLVVYAAAFLAIPPLNWSQPVGRRLLLPTALFALSFVFFPWLGFGIFSLWAYVGVAAGMSLVPIRTGFGYIVGVALLTAVFAWAAGLDSESVFFATAIIGSVSLMMAAFGRLIASVNQLRATQHELARLAVEQERSRVARDMHDILGHSLTVITVKAELAGRLVEVDPERAGREIAEVEELARGALADVRTTVAGYRGVSIASELANARSALESASIAAHLPGSVDMVPAEHRELFGWVVREGITNVVRHSHARNCTVELDGDSIEVRDDGTGATDGSAGSGLQGLRERVESAGLRMTAGPAPTGGFLLRVSA